MWLVLCDPADVSALWAGQGLRARGLNPVEFVSPMELVCSRRIEFSSDNGEPAHASADFADGRRVDVRDMCGTLNRAARVEYPQIRRAAPGDRTYVQAEMDAILLAWLGTLPAPVFNPAHPSGWGGAQLHSFVWALRAQAAGFQTPPHRCSYAGMELPTTRDYRQLSSHIVLGGRSFPSVPQDIERASARLAEGTGIPLLGITLAWMPDGSAMFIGGTAEPDLRVGGTAFLDALRDAFASS